MNGRNPVTAESRRDRLASPASRAISRYLEKSLIFIGLVLSGIFLANIGLATSWASPDDSYQFQSAPTISEDQAEPSTPWHKKIGLELGGHIKVRGSVSWPDDESVFKPVGTGTYYDGDAEGRLKNRLFLGKWGYFETHYEAVLSGGDTWKKGKELERLFPGLFKDGLLLNHPLEDDRRLLDLTKTIHEGDNYTLYHRLDRLSLTLLPKWGVVRIGRQAVTWGNGLLFNPMDLFNPFSPADIERDYKVGDDMVSAQFSLNRIGDFHFLYVPRRDPASGDVKWNQSSLAGKLHFAWGTTEFDLMLAKHYKDAVVGFGSTGYVGGTAWRLDGTWTFLNDKGDKNGYFSLAANIDYSWVWWKKNFYGFLEFFYNGLGKDDYPDAFSNLNIAERLNRGELFTLDRIYLSGHIRVELHPLINIYLTVINNLADPSGIIQPRAVWDMFEDVQITFGGNMYYGRRGTEYGGFKIPGTHLMNRAPDSAFIWMTYFY
jgi:hypothetical protein